MQGRLLIVRLPARDRLGAHVRNLDVKHTDPFSYGGSSTTCHRETGDEFRRIAKRRLTDLFPERNRFAA
jgi:hypothetical protein